MNQSFPQITAPADYIDFKEEWIHNSVAALFEARMKSYSDRPAVIMDGSVMTYGELNREANRMAVAILERCPFHPIESPEGFSLKSLEEHAEPVVVFLEQGVQAVTAAIGLLKAGKVFVSVDPDDPHTRNRHILNHAPARVVVTNSAYLEEVRKLAPVDAHLINIDLLGETDCHDNPSLSVSPLDPALLVYTSGSTGQPKGIVHSHENLLHDILVKTDLMKVSPSDRMALLAWGTGQAIKIIFGALLNGAALCLYNLKQSGLAHLSGWLQHEKITFLTISSPIFRIFSESITGNDAYPDMRLLRLASDMVYPEDIARSRSLFPGASLINALSSNETGTVAAIPLDSLVPSELELVPIGYSVRDVSLQLLTEDGRPVTGDAPGILAISSHYIASGYWRNPELSEKSFSRNPVNPDLITFTSGDLAKWRPDGALELCGRNDFQVKIRGYRVDTSEVEAALLQHENISEAVAHPFEDKPGNKRLVGYIVARKRPAPSSSALVRFLRERVTDYMIPAAFVLIDKIPLLPNGKTNRRALPAPGNERPELDSPFEAPQTQIEAQLVEIWTQVVGIQTVGIHDPFMELGGDSLRAGQVMARILELFGVDLPLRLLFESSTVAKIAEVIQSSRSRSGERVRTIERQEGSGPWELSFGQQRLWFLDQFYPESTAYNMPKLIRLKGDVNVAALKEACEWLIKRHEVLRTRYIADTGVPVAVVGDCADFRLPVIDLSGIPDTEREKRFDDRISEESSRLFDLESDLMFRASLYRMGEADYILLCVTHHIASDGWSRGILVRELVSHYNSIVRGEPSSLDDLPIQYSDFARWQLKQIESQPLLEQLNYWKDLLAGAPELLDFPADRPRPAEFSSSGFAYELRISRNRLDALVDFARRENVTMFMLLAAAFDVLLFRYTRKTDIVLGFPEAGRRAVETENLIGFFVNSLALRVDLSGNPEFRNFLGRVRERALGAYANADVPFEQLVGALRLPRDVSRNPVFQVMFDVHRLQTPIMEAGGTVFQLMDVKRESCPMDQIWNIAIIEDGMRLRVQYRTDLFDESTVQKMAEQYRLLLDDILSNPETPINTLAAGNYSRTPLPEETAQVMRGIWMSLLAVDSANPGDDFFEMGGHSLLAMRFVSKVRSTLNVRLSIREFFDFPTLGGLMRLVASKQASEGYRDE